MINYKLQNGQNGQPCAVTIIEQNISIPMDESNSDYKKYLEWIAEGNEPLPADE